MMNSHWTLPTVHAHTQDQSICQPGTLAVQCTVMRLFAMHVLELCAVPPAAGERVVVCAVVLLLVVAVLEEHQADLACVPRDGRWDVKPVVLGVEFGADALELFPLGVGHGNAKPSMFAHEGACHESAT